ncbi:hypothetical protein RO865_06530 [Blautia faecis]|jgi:hypothetical protein|uniref:hypothetical protein n=1 Tax=Blautia faecis TaxID=871665 RepID=UPI002061828C|nr:hypothetical protein [Blautia faecis]MDT4368475.1 hypothetical protein [Blautia faecis]DAM25629.1 MAG TPA: hypothetical protein [Caudoviricetes sp.]DAW38379.1 MAG TPA: hypothetical protein [Caudoviricetes sp.]
MANILISDVRMTPNPVNVGASFVLSVKIIDKVYALATKDGKYLMTKNNKVIEKIPRKD